jgi:hypothetical protein
MAAAVGVDSRPAVVVRDVVGDEGPSPVGLAVFLLRVQSAVDDDAVAVRDAVALPPLDLVLVVVSDVVSNEVLVAGLVVHVHR